MADKISLEEMNGGQGLVPKNQSVLPNLLVDSRAGHYTLK
jgi:hypothetical protein